MNTYTKSSNTSEDNMKDASKKVEAEMNQLKGKANKVKGDVKIGVGKMIDSPKLKAKGLADKAKGTAQEIHGKAQEIIADTKKNLKK